MAVLAGVAIQDGRLIGRTSTPCSVTLDGKSRGFPKLLFWTNLDFGDTDFRIGGRGRRFSFRADFGRVTMTLEFLGEALHTIRTLFERFQGLLDRSQPLDDAAPSRKIETTMPDSRRL